MTLARTLVRRYSRSSQVADRLDRMFKTEMLPNTLKVVQNVETRWWTTFTMVDRLLYLENAKPLHEKSRQNW